MDGKEKGKAEHVKGTADIDSKDWKGQPGNKIPTNDEPEAVRKRRESEFGQMDLFRL